MTPVTLAIDAMSGDRGPEVAVTAALEAVAYQTRDLPDGTPIQLKAQN